MKKEALTIISNEQLYNIHGGSHNPFFEVLHTIHVCKELFNDFVDFHNETPGEGDHAMKLLVKGKQWLASWIVSPSPIALE